MWDNTTVMRIGSTAMFAVSVMLVLYGGLHYLVHLPTLLPLRTVQLQHAPEQVDADEVLQVVRENVHGNFFTVDIEQLRSKIEGVPWVRSVQIRRSFPDSLEVDLEEHQTLARWNDDDLVNRQGEVFTALSDEELPSFIGQPGESQLVTEEYARYNEQLSKVGLKVMRISESARHAWQLRLSNGITLELGSEQMQERLARFVAVYPYSLANMQEVKTVDLRYRNGFAVGGMNKQS